ADCVTKGGNLLLNTGPRGDGSLCPMQVERLLAVGQWLGHSGEAIHATRPWHTPSATAADGRTLRFTTHGPRLYAIVLEGGATFPVGTGIAALETTRPRPLGPDTNMPRAWRLA
ncbi:MAG: alpha-L-fucosidase, partial [Sandarakinorhabdus sp.]